MTDIINKNNKITVLALIESYPEAQLREAEIKGFLQKSSESLRFLKCILSQDHILLILK